MTIPFIVSELLFDAVEATETKELKTDFDKAKIVVIEFTTVDFTGTLDFQGKIHEQGAFSNIPYVRQDQLAAQTPAVAQLSYSTDDAVYRYVLLGFWRFYKIIMTRSNGAITLAAGGSSHGQLFPRIVVA